MPVFLFVILGAYSAVHIYTFFKLRAAFPFGGAAGGFIALFMAAMVCAPILVRVMERYGYDSPARLLSFIGYVWMGVIFLFFTLSVLTDLYRILLHGAGLLSGKNTVLFMPSAKVLFLIPLVAALLLSVYGYFEALNIRARAVRIPSDKISADPGRLRIVQISDVHLGLIVKEMRLRRIIKVIEEAVPDILISTGDLVDGQIDGLDLLADALGKIQPHYGKYAITGNHEFYAGLPHSLAITKRAGFTLLRGASVTIPGVISIAGVDDPAGRRFGLSEGLPEDKLLTGLPTGTFTLLLKHQPHIRTNSIGLFDLQVSGHTHDGQIFPFRYMVRMVFPRIAGLYDLSKGSRLYVSRGTGTWGPPFRIFAPPEVTVIDIVHDRRTE